MQREDAMLKNTLKVTERKKWKLQQQMLHDIVTRADVVSVLQLLLFLDDH